ncbi:MAG TPA: YkvA family protein [Chryseolinea sp.]|nr:YkvA family protein [Chryseolinea sp.]
MNNKFFDVALSQAARLLGKKSRILVLLAKLGSKMNKVNWSPVERQLLKDKIFTFGRLAKAYATGKYRQVPWRAMLIVLAAVIYFINPLDLIPDLIPFVGFTDDFAILLWVYNSIQEEVDKFLEWEESQVRPL